MISTTNRVYRLTPGQLDVFQDCGYRFATDLRTKLQGFRHIERPNFNLALGKAVHELINHVNQTLMGGADSFNTNEIMRRFWNRSHFAEPEHAVEAEHVARTVMSNYQAYLQETGFTVLASEQFIKTPVMTVLERIPLVLSGKIDTILQGANGTILCMDWKTGNSLPAPDMLVTRLSSTAYHCLAKMLYTDTSTILIGQMLLGTAVATVVELPAEIYEGGKQAIRDLVIALDNDPSMTAAVFQPRAGEYCAWCSHQEICPLFSYEGRVIEAAF